MKKGFTLIELLAVLIILGLLTLIIVPNVTGTLRKQKDSLYKIQIKNIEEAAKGWAGENFFSLPNTDGGFKSIYLKELESFIDINIENPKNGKKFGKCLVVNITKVPGTENYTYEVDDTTIENNTGC